MSASISFLQMVTFPGPEPVKQTNQPLHLKQIKQTNQPLHFRFPQLYRYDVSVHFILTDGNFLSLALNLPWQGFSSRKPEKIGNLSH
jgi:hypothetical protein